MPELPEVETIRAGLQRHLPGRSVVAVELRRADLRWPIPTRRVHALRGLCCQSIARRSKYLQLHFTGARERDQVVLIHLGMSGRLFVQEMAGRKAPRPPWILHEHWRLDFGDRLLRFTDARRFGMLDVVAPGQIERHQLIEHLGPEPFAREFNAESVFRLTRGRRAAIKSFLMDARNVVGVGNIYASEACFRARLRPRKAVGRLTRSQCRALVLAVRAVLADAIAKGGTTLRDYISVDREQGMFQMSLDVYGRDGEPCHRCGAIIRRVVDGARSTYYCPRCQA